MAQPLAYPEGHGSTPTAIPSSTAISSQTRGRTSAGFASRTAWIAVASTIVAFTIVNILVLVFQPYLMRLASYDFQYTSARVADYYFSPRPDIIFLGSSRALEGFDPQIAESEVARLSGAKVRALNLGITGASIELNYLLLKNVIQDSKKPAFIVYGFSEFDLDPDFAPLQEATLPYYTMFLRPDDFALYAGPSLDDKVHFLLTTLCPLCRDTTLIRNALSIVFNPDDPSHKYFAPGPYHLSPLPGGKSVWLHPGPGPKSLIQENYLEYAARLKKYHVSSRRVELLNDLLALGRKRGIHMVLVNMPVTAVLRHMWSSPAAIRRYDVLVRRIAARNHATLLDLYSVSPRIFPRKDFLDLHHLDDAGATLLTRMVVRHDIVPLIRHGGSGAR